MQRTTMDLWVGLFVIMGVGALLILSLKIGNLNTYSAGQSYQLVGNFENIGGLKVRAPVKSSGVVVGRVADIRFSLESYDAVVTVNIDNRYLFPKDTFASILTADGLRPSTKAATRNGKSPSATSTAPKMASWLKPKTAVRKPAWVYRMPAS